MSMSSVQSTDRPELILASASPRRRQILSAAGLRFAVEPSDVDEDFDPLLAPGEAGTLLAARKAALVAGRHAGSPRWVIAADTLVALEPLKPSGPWRYLGKPLHAEEARSFLRLLSGTRHLVVTGVAVQRCSDSAAFVGRSQTWVSMRSLSAAEIDAYVVSEEWCGKAGGYAIQESADAFVTGLEGGFDTVVGLPLALTLELLARAGLGELPGASA